MKNEQRCKKCSRRHDMNAYPATAAWLRRKADGASVVCIDRKSCRERRVTS